jgi:hypothetical protein
MKKAIVMCCLTFFTAGLVFLASDAPRDEGKVAALGVSAAYAQQAGVDTTVPEVGHRIEDGTYVSDKIPMGAVASLCFVEKGNFEYYARKAVKMAYGAGDDQSQIRGTRGTITIE